jgi:hypothetical protein
MRLLSATEALSPSIDRTKAILFQPFRKGRTWKLSATAYLARASTIFLPFPLFYLFFLPAAHRTGGVALAAALAIGLLLVTAIGVWIFHLCTRLSFAFFDIVLFRGEFVAPAWRKYGPQSRKWTGFKVLLGTVVTAVFAVPIATYFVRMFSVLSSIKPGQPPSPEFMATIFAAYFFFYFGFGIFYFVSSLLGDFILPSLALENTTLTEAFRRFFELIRREPGQVALYALIKFFLGIALYMGAFIAFEIIVILVTLILALFFGVIGFLLHLIGVPTAILYALAIFIGFLWYLFIGFYGAILVLGGVLTFFEAYNLYFLGGRYPLLGDLLEPPISATEPPPAFQPPPIFPATPSSYFEPSP